MFHPTVISAALDRLYADPHLAPLIARLPDGLEPYPVEWCHQMREDLDSLYNEETKTTARPLTLDEELFVFHEQLRCKVDYEYCATRYHWISAEGVGLKPLFPLWESQRVALDAFARLELKRHQDQWGPVMALVLKARQLGLSTLTQSILTHKTTNQGHLRAMVASDVEDSSKHLYGMFETILDKLPWWLKPGVRNKAVGERRVFDTGTVYWAAWGKSGRGGLKDKGGQKGNLGRGKTISQFHLSELSTWEYPEQLDDGFFPAVPLAISSFGVGESTAKGRGDWWHTKCVSAMNGGNDFILIFIPWYAEISKYARPAPVDWSPDEKTLAHAARAEKEGPKYLGKRVTLTREQLYWWEHKRKSFEESGALYKFLEEYPAEPEEAFQYSGRSCFPIHIIERTRNLAKPPVLVCELQPQTAAARIAHDERQKLVAAEQGLPYERQPIDDPTVQRPLVPVLLPDGYGFRALGTRELRARKDSMGERGLLDLLQIWEPPRRRGPRRYVLGVDVSEGVGLDRSVIDVIRCPTLFEPAEQVAQFITDSRTPVQLAYCCDALGRWYTDEDHVEAMAAIEVNIGPGGSTQDTLQLHLGYGHFFIWEYIDAADPSRRRSNRIGWATNARTRPMLLSRFYSAVVTLDPITNSPDLVINSPWTIADMQNFVSETGRLEEGEALRGFYDDCVMGGGIGIYAAWRAAGGEHIPIDERRRQRTAEAAIQAERADQQRRDWRNTPCPAEYALDHLRPEDDPGDPDITTRFYNEQLPREDLDNSLLFRYHRG